MSLSVGYSTVNCEVANRYSIILFYYSLLHSCFTSCSLFIFIFPGGHFILLLVYKPYIKSKLSLRVSVLDWRLFFLVWVREVLYSQLKRRRRLVVLCAITRANAFSFHIPLCALVAYWSRAVVLHTTKSHSQRHLPSYSQETLVCHLFTFQFFRNTETSASICYCSILIAPFFFTIVQSWRNASPQAGLFRVLHSTLKA